MKIKFYSISDGQTIKYETDAIDYNEDMYLFLDKSLPNTTLYLEKLNNDSLLFKRYGDTQMEIVFSKHNKSMGTYKNSMGLDFEFEAYTNDLIIYKDKISIDYEFYFDNIHQGNFKIYILIK